METKNLKMVHNLCLRYQSYDRAGTKYAYDILYTTLYSAGEAVKAKRHSGADSFHRHIKELTEKYEGVAAITVTDYHGTAHNARMLNPPMHIELMNAQSSKKNTAQSLNGQTSGQTVNTVPDIWKGLSGWLAGSEFEGFGNLAPVAKFIHDKHTIRHLQEDYETQSKRLADLERSNAALSGKYKSLELTHENLLDDMDELENELTYYRKHYKKQDKIMSVVGLAGASIAKTFLRQNLDILSGILPIEQLSGILSGDAQMQTPEFSPDDQLSEAQQLQLKDATAAFEWLQSLEKPIFDEVISVIVFMQQEPDQTTHIIQMIQES